MIWLWLALVVIVAVSTGLVCCWVCDVADNSRRLEARINNHDHYQDTFFEGFNCHQADNKKDMKALRKKQNDLELKVLALEALLVYSMER